VENTLQVCFGRSVEFGILGPLEARVDGRAVGLGGPRQRAVLALLLLHANEVVSRDRLIEGLWGESPPPAAGRSLDSYVSRLRALLGADRIERRSPGYVLLLDSGELDLERFERLLEQGRAALAGGDARAAGDRLGEALALWRGPALADLLYEPFASGEGARLEERRLLAIETRNDAGLELGQGADLVAELEQLVARNPFRERLLGQLMLALYRAGRASDALAAYQEGRRRLSGELGLELSPALRELERGILAHDPALGSPAPPRPVVRLRSGRRRAGIVLAGLALAAGAIAAVVALVAGGSGGAHGSGAIVELGPTAGGGSRIAAAPAAMAADASSVWAAEPDAGAVVRVDRASRRVVQSIPVGGSPAVVAVGGGAVWAAGIPGDTIVRIDPATGRQTQRFSLGGAQVGALAYWRGTLWVVDVSDRELIGIDAATGTERRTFELLVKPSALAVGAGGIWIADYDAGVVTEISAANGTTLATVRVGKGPSALAVGAGSVWVANTLDSTVSRVNVARGAVAATIPVGSSPAALATDGSSVWVADEDSASLSRIDARTDAVVETSKLAGGPTSVVALAGRVWVGTRPFERRTGGMLRLLKSTAISIDPALQLEIGPLQSNGFTSDDLVAYNHASGPAGSELVPDLAIALPVPSGGATTYTFRLRPGIRYSNGEPLRARDFRRAFERLFRVASPGRAYFSGIVGASACTRSRCDLARGVVTDDASRRVTFHLTAPDPAFLEKLSIGALSSPVPDGTPWHAVTTPIPGTGPYRIAAASSREIRYIRNAYFHEWSHAAQPTGNPDEIVMRFGSSPAQEIRSIERHEADWSYDGVPSQLLPEVTTRYTSRVHDFSGTGVDFLQLNTTLPPFDDVRVRRALNFAVDRALVTRLYGGRFAASPTCQVLPPGILGYSRYCPYTRNPSGTGAWKAPDLPEARRLIAASHTRGQQVTLWGTPGDPPVQQGVVRYLVTLLKRLGYRARAHIVTRAFFDAHPNAFRTIQLTPPSWVDETPYNFFAPWLVCGAPYNHRWFCSRRVDRTAPRAQALESADPRTSAAQWAALDRFVTDQAAWVPLVNPRAIDFVSTRVGNYQHHPVLGVIADQLTVN
jgi:ABC-type transport system substrate-binding protein/DNA-binding SARP family transcriptional activator